MKGALLLKLRKIPHLKRKAEEEWALGNEIKERMKSWGDREEQRNHEKNREGKKEEAGISISTERSD